MRLALNDMLEAVAEHFQLLAESKNSTRQAQPTANALAAPSHIVVAADCVAATDHGHQPRRLVAELQAIKLEHTVQRTACTTHWVPLRCITTCMTHEGKLYVRFPMYSALCSRL